MKERFRQRRWSSPDTDQVVKVLEAACPGIDIPELIDTLVMSDRRRIYQAVLTRLQVPGGGAYWHRSYEGRWQDQAVGAGWVVNILAKELGLEPAK